jgi:hypothetical protein
MAPSSESCPNWASVIPGVRVATAHEAWVWFSDCTARRPSTTAAGDGNVCPDKRSVCIRQRAIARSFVMSRRLSRSG